MSVNLNVRQTKLLRAIRDYWKTRRIPPTIRELGEMAGIPSTSNVVYHLDILQGHGLIDRIKGTPRGILLTEEGEDHAA